ncbi:MAG: immunoglobulin domain-containing protein [Verrucomicrobiota bacterium]
MRVSRLLALAGSAASFSAAAFPYQDTDLLLVFRKDGVAYNDVTYNLGNVSNYFGLPAGSSIPVTNWDASLAKASYNNNLSGVKFIVMAISPSFDTINLRRTWITVGDSNAVPKNVRPSAQAVQSGNIGGVGVALNGLDQSATPSYVIANSDGSSYTYICSGGGTGDLASQNGSFPYSVEQAIPGTSRFFEIKAVNDGANATQIGSLSMALDGTLTFIVGGGGAVAPAISTPPQSQVAKVGSNISFTVTATGTAPLSYQWRFYGTNLAGQTAGTLSLNNVQAIQAGGYSVIVANSAGSVTSAVATLTVVQPPSFSSQPTNQTVIAGNNVTFSVTAVGDQPLFYQWYGLGSLLTQATNATLALSNVQPAQAGSYYVVITNASGSVTSSVATLMIALPPAIIGQPTNQSANVGSTLTLTVTATGTAPLFYQWLRNGSPVGANNFSLTLNNAQVGDAGSYSVVVTNAYGSATSAVAVITIIPPVAPAFTVQPTNQSVLLGSNVSFTAAASGTAPIAYVWRLNGASLPGATNLVLALTNIQSGNAGNYTIIASNVAGIATSAVATLSVLLPPTITANPTNQVVQVGSTAGFHLVASGTAPLSYRWFTNGTAIGNATNADLSLTNVQLAEAGNYYAVVTNAYGSATSAVATLTVTLPQQPPLITGQPSNKTANAGATVTLTASAVGTDPLFYQWLHNGSPVGANNLSLTLNNAQVGDAGSYSVVVTNAYGSATSAVAVVTIQTAPTFTVQPTNQSALVGTTISFTAAAAGTAPISYFWRQNGASLAGATNSVLSLANIQGSNAGDYTIIASNVVGVTTSLVATLTALYPPTIASSPTNQMVLAGGTALFHVGATGTGPLSYQWFKNSSAIGNATNGDLSLINVQATEVGGYYAVVTNAYGSATSLVAALTVVFPPAITVNPTNETVFSGVNVGFFVAGTGTAPLTYQWYRNGTLLTNATSAILAFNNVQVASAGNYVAVLQNPYGSATSAVATLTVNIADSNGPVITVTSAVTTSNRIYSLAGTVTDASRGNNGVAHVAVNGVLLTNVSGVDGAGVSWSRTITLVQGTNKLTVAAADTLNNWTTNQFSVVFVPAEKIRPTLTITAPKTPTLSNQVVVAGTATDAKGVAEVWCRFNSNQWVLAVGTTKWSILLTPPAATNFLNAYAVDTSGNYSTTQTVKFVKIASALLVVNQTGTGTVTPNLNNNVLEAGTKDYTMKAKPGTGYLFSNWVAQVSGVTLWTTNKVDVKFRMMSNLVLTANFVPNRFIPMKGDYLGMFAPTNDASVDWTNAGAVKLSLTDQGTFTAQLMYQGKVYPWAGAFDLSGQYSNVISRGKESALPVQIQLQTGALSIDGFIGLGNGVNVPLWADGKLVAKNTPFKGTYTLQPTNDLGVLTVKVLATGAATLSGKLADKTVVNQASSITTNGVLVIYQSLYLNKGMLLGWIQCQTNGDGELHWQKPAPQPDPQGFKRSVIVTVR